MVAIQRKVIMMDLLILLSHEWRIMPFSCFMAGILYIVDTVKAIIYQHIN